MTTRLPSPTFATHGGAMQPVRCGASLSAGGLAGGVASVGSIGAAGSNGNASGRGKRSSSWLSGRRVFKRGSDERPMGDMNTTPLIDVMLVLLVMFIITVPIQTHSVKVDLPNTPEPTTKADPVKNKLTIDANNVLAWNGTMVDQRQLAELLAATKAFPVPPELQFQPDERARYVVVDETLATIKHANVSRLGFVGNEQYIKAF